jgi:predicted nucleic acid-binding protein
MKWIFNVFYVFILILTFKCYGREIILVENLASQREGEVLKDLLINKFNIPIQLMTFKKANHLCSHSPESVLHICLKKNGEIEILRMNKEILEKNLSAIVGRGDSNAI